ncbi:MAG: transcriptional regulator NrdR [Desulfobacterales bacterium]|nr:transcriptional regulator NrdR [Desulfobacterales bacterium]
MSAALPGEIDLEVRRRRECQACSQRFTTYERVEQVPVMIVKKDGRREEYDREKVLRGITKACEKRAISMDRIEELMDGIERELRELSEREIASTQVGERIMAALKTLDDVAYVRFASVYREFTNVDDFIEELKALQSDECRSTQLEGLSDNDRS